MVVLGPVTAGIHTNEKKEVLKLILLGIKHKTIISSVDIILRNMLSLICVHESSSSIIVKGFFLVCKLVKFVYDW